MRQNMFDACPNSVIWHIDFYIIIEFNDSYDRKYNQSLTIFIYDSNHPIFSHLVKNDSNHELFSVT